jgi:hydrogenase-1 operon protein HyaF
MKPFPISVVALGGLGAGTHSEEETLDYLPMPKDMNTFEPPRLPEPEELAGHDAVRPVLEAVLAALAQTSASASRAAIPVSLQGLAAEDLALLNQVLGEGETSICIDADGDGLEIRIQESIFTGVWRVLTLHHGVAVDDCIEVGAIPTAVAHIAQEDAQHPPSAWRGAWPVGVQNAPLLLTELQDRVAAWRVGEPAHVVNLSLLPVTPEDIGFLDHQLGTGRVLLLSRGYGNCRITHTRHPHCWRVVYYNAMDTVILNTVEVVDLPEVALAAPEDLQDSHERLEDVLRYVSDVTEAT